MSAVYSKLNGYTVRPDVVALKLAVDMELFLVTNATVQKSKLQGSHELITARLLGLYA